MCVSIYLSISILLCFHEYINICTYLIRAFTNIFLYLCTHACIHVCLYNCMGESPSLQGRSSLAFFLSRSPRFCGCAAGSDAMQRRIFSRCQPGFYSSAFPIVSVDRRIFSISTQDKYESKEQTRE